MIDNNLHIHLDILGTLSTFDNKKFPTKLRLRTLRHVFARPGI